MTEQDTEFLTSFSNGKRDVKPENVIKVARIVETLNCKVEKTNGWKDLEIQQEFKLVLDKTIRFGKEIGLINQFWCQSSEHLVFFAIMVNKQDGNRRNVIVKFHLATETDSSSVRIAHMTQEHCENIIRNYNQAKAYLRDCQKDELCRNISIVGVCIASTEIPGFLWGKSEGNNLWIEEFVPNFGRLWRRQPAVKLKQRMIACTDIIKLQEFQDLVYERSRQRHTICDLQGGFDQKTCCYVLCDIEFTDTLEKFGWKNNDLIDEYWKDKVKRKKPSGCVIS